MIERAFAKINLGLDITGKRADGYHLVRMIMQTLSLHDTLAFDREEEPGVRLSCDRPELETGADNLICRAAELFFRKYEIGAGVRIHLEKRIPLAAGLAGGSADAAATLRALNAIFETHLTDEELCGLGVRIGADVPFCICGGTALCEGIGEILTPLESLGDCAVVLAKPRIGISTAEAYRDYDAETEIRHPAIDAQAQALRRRSVTEVAGLCGNVLEPVVSRRHPEIVRLREQLLAGGACGARMSGSGPTVYGIFTDRIRAEQVAKRLLRKEENTEIFVTEPITAGGRDDRRQTGQGNG